MFDFLGFDSLEEAFAGEGFGGSFEYTEEDDNLMESYEAIDCYDDVDEALPRLAMEQVENFHLFTTAVTVNEFAEYVRTNTEVVYESGKIKSIFDNIRKLIEKAWQKIKGFFIKLFDTIEGKLKGDKAWAEKVRPQVDKYEGSVKVPNTVKFKDTVKNADLYDKIVQGLIASESAKLLTSTHLGKETTIRDSIVEDDMNKIRQSLAGKGDKSEFSQALKEYFADKEKVTITLDKTKALAQLEEIASAKTYKKNARAAYADVKKMFSRMLKGVKDFEKSAKKGSEESEYRSKIGKVVGKNSSLINKCITLSHDVLRVHMAAIRAQHSQARSLVNKVLSEVKKTSKGKEKEDSANESTDFINSIEFM